LSTSLTSSEDEYGPTQSSAYLPAQASTSEFNASSIHRDRSRRDASEPLAASGVVPAGFGGPEDANKGFDGKPYGVDPFEDDEGPSAYTFSDPQSGPYARTSNRSRWARIKEDHLTDVDWTMGLNKLLGRRSKFDGVPRELALNDPEANRAKGFENNSVSTGHYGPITFVPKFLYCGIPCSGH
jgi:phospholipid-transporting ATPase